MTENKLLVKFLGDIIVNPGFNIHSDEKGRLFWQDVAIEYLTEIKEIVEKND